MSNKLLTIAWDLLEIIVKDSEEHCMSFFFFFLKNGLFCFESSDRAYILED